MVIGYDGSKNLMVQSRVRSDAGLDHVETEGNNG